MLPVNVPLLLPVPVDAAAVAPTAAATPALRRRITTTTATAAATRRMAPPAAAPTMMASGGPDAAGDAAGAAPPWDAAMAAAGPNTAPCATTPLMGTWDASAAAVRKSLNAGPPAAADMLNAASCACSSAAPTPEPLLEVLQATVATARKTTRLSVVSSRLRSDTLPTSTLAAGAVVAVGHVPSPPCMFTGSDAATGVTAVALLADTPVIRTSVRGTRKKQAVLDRSRRPTGGLWTAEEATPPETATESGI